MYKYILSFLVLVCILSTCFAVETGQYRYYTYGQDFNLGQHVSINGVLDTNFNSDCNAIIKQDNTGILLADNNIMLHDNTLKGFYYVPITASNTTLWTKGKYSSIMTCYNKDVNLTGTENISFILERDVIQTIIDTNAIGRGLNDDQNDILYDLNKWVVGSAVDYTAPIVTINYPLINSTVSATLVEFSIYDKSDINNISIIVNGLSSSIFNQTTNCDSQWNCSYYETGLNINIYNDLNIIVNDEYGNTSNTYTTFLYSSTRPRTSFGASTQTFLDNSIEVDPIAISLELEKNTKTTQKIRIKNNTAYDLFLSIAPSSDLAGKVYINFENRVLQAHDEKEYEISFISDESVNGNLVVSSQYSSKNISVELKTKPINYMPILLIIACLIGAYFIFVRN